MINTSTLCAEIRWGRSDDKCINTKCAASRCCAEQKRPVNNEGTSCVARSLVTVQKHQFIEWLRSAVQNKCEKSHKNHFKHPV